MNKPIQLVAIWDDRDNTEHVTAIVYGTRTDIELFKSLLETAADDEVSYNGWSRYDVYCNLVQKVKNGGFWLIDFDVDLELDEAQAVRKVNKQIQRFI